MAQEEIPDQQPIDFEALLGDGKMKISQSEKIAAGTAPRVTNTPQEAQTILVEGMNGMAITGHLTKIYMTEHFVEDGKLLSRHVLNLAIPNDQFSQIATLLKTIADQTLPPKDGEE